MSSPTENPPFPAPPGCWLLALESSTPRGGVALSSHGELKKEILLEEGLRHGRDLVPAAKAALDSEGVRASDLAAVAVSLGPGSYTGLRVGVMSAKALAYGASRPLVGVSSLSALAFRVLLENGRRFAGRMVMVLQDARRDEVYAGLYRLGETGPREECADRATTPEEAAAWLRSLSGSRPLAVGSALRTYADVFSFHADSRPDIDFPSPSATGALGWREFLAGNFRSPLEAQPVYLRRDGGHSWKRDPLIKQ